MGKAKDFWREMVPILGRTHPAFRTRVRPAERGPDHDNGDLQSEVQGLREQVRELSDELDQQRKVLSGVVAKVGGEDPPPARSEP